MLKSLLIVAVLSISLILSSCGITEYKTQDISVSGISDGSSIVLNDVSSLILEKTNHCENLGKQEYISSVKFSVPNAKRFTASLKNQPGFIKQIGTNQTYVFSNGKDIFHLYDSIYRNNDNKVFEIKTVYSEYAVTNDWNTVVYFFPLVDYNAKGTHRLLSVFKFDSNNATKSTSMSWEDLSSYYECLDKDFCIIDNNTKTITLTARIHDKGKGKCYFSDGFIIKLIHGETDDSYTIAVELIE